MKAIQIQSHGGPEVLKVATVPDPKPGTGEVLVRIKASAINPLDGIVRLGYFPIAKKPPVILGEEAAGVVARAGSGFKAGERVIVYGGGLGVFRDGTWAELVAVPAPSLRRLPKGVAFEEGAALPNVGVTAYGALRTAELKAGEILVVLGATGGVGSAGVQIGKAMGARVIAVLSTPEKAAKVQALGADHVVALSGAPLAEQVQQLTAGRGADAVLDPIGGEAAGKGLAALGSFGRLVHLGYSAGMSLTINSLDLIAKPSRILGFNIFMVPADRSAKDLDEVMAMAARKKYRGVVDKTFPMARVAEATRHLEGRKAVGKVVLTV
ncbi:MAG: quinone oxidoreductase family protein [Candidatus Methylomirabilales bacterium]